MCVLPVVSKIASHLYIFHDLAQGEGTPTYMYKEIRVLVEMLKRTRAKRYQDSVWHGLKFSRSQEVQILKQRIALYLLSLFFWLNTLQC